MKKLLLSLAFVAASFATQAQTWLTQATGFTDASRGISDIQIVNATTAWAEAFDGSGGGANVQEVTITSDGGTTWTPAIIDIGDPAMAVANFSPVSATKAWLAVSDPTAGQGGVWKTTDAGVTWTQQNATAFTAAASWCDGVHFFDENVGIVWGDPTGTTFEAYRTVDGGDNWVPMLTPTITAGDFAYTGRGFQAVGNALWFPTAKGKIYRTLDRGLTWTKLNTPIPDFGGAITATSRASLYMSDVNNGMIVGATDVVAATAGSGTWKIYRTTNGGTTWSAGVVYTGYRLMTYVPGTTTLVACGAGVGSGGTGSAKSNDNGVTWTPIDTGTQRLKPAFFDGTTGWCGGFTSDPTTDGIFRIDGTVLGNDSFAVRNFSISPNPANNVVTISSKDVSDYNLNITDITGKVVLQKTISGLENSIDISSLASGAYMFTLNSDNKTETVKIIKN